MILHGLKRAAAVDATETMEQYSRHLDDVSS